MKTCTCGKQLDNSAKFCPGCGKPFRVTSGFTKLVGVLILAAFAIGGISAIVTPEHPAPVLSAAEQAAKQKSEAAFQRAVAGAKQLKKSMRNPDSFKLSEALIMDDSAVCYEYRAQNGFGGMNVSHADLAPNDQFKSSDSPGYTTLWNKECGNKTGVDKTWQVGYAAGFHGILDDK